MMTVDCKHGNTSSYSNVEQAHAYTRMHTQSRVGAVGPVQTGYATFTLVRLK